MGCLLCSGGCPYCRGPVVLRRIRKEWTGAVFWGLKPHSRWAIKSTAVLTPSEALRWLLWRDSESRVSYPDWYSQGQSAIVLREVADLRACYRLEER